VSRRTTAAAVALVALLVSACSSLPGRGEPAASPFAEQACAAYGAFLNATEGQPVTPGPWAELAAAVSALESDEFPDGPARLARSVELDYEYLAGEPLQGAEPARVDEVRSDGLPRVGIVAAEVPLAEHLNRGAACREDLPESYRQHTDRLFLALPADLPPGDDDQDGSDGRGDSPEDLAGVAPGVDPDGALDPAFDVLRSLTRELAEAGTSPRDTDGVIAALRAIDERDEKVRIEVEAATYTAERTFSLHVPTGASACALLGEEIGTYEVTAGHCGLKPSRAKLGLNG
jgi:hypothetical protein